MMLLKNKAIGPAVIALMVSAAAACTANEQLQAETPASEAVSGWKTVWFDGFDGAKLDRSKWAPEVSCWGGGNNERQCYTGRDDNIVVDDGVLRLIALPEVHTGPLHHDEPDGATRTQQYTSGKIRTAGLHAWKYGRFSARMKLHEGQGAWPAFWMMPEDDLYGDWPLSGELDIMEAVNLGTPCEECPNGIEQRTSGALHFGAPIPNNTYLYLEDSGERLPGPAEEWRVYSVEWAEGVIQWFVDDEIFMRIESDEWRTEAPNAQGRPYAPFDQPFHLALNLAVGGNKAEKSNDGGFDETTFPAELKVDWVRVEQCDGDATGRTCLTNAEWTGAPKGPWEVIAR